MQIIDWNKLDAAQRDALLERPRLVEDTERDAQVARIIEQVRADGDHALRALTRRFDGVAIGDIALDPSEIAAGAARVAPAVRSAIARARETLTRWHRETTPGAFEVETAPGVRCGRIVRPIRTVGLYVPAGTAPLPSTALMLGVPATLAGCREIVICSPPDADGRVDDAVLAVAAELGIRRVCRVGGAQAIAAMAFGTGSVPRCDKLFGPGNAWVTRAKQQVAQAVDGAAIDMPAGPSEVLVVADEAADPEFVATDLLSQAEHGPDSQALLVTSSPALAGAVAKAVDRIVEDLPRAATTRQALAHSALIVVHDLEAAMDLANRYAPEHLILQLADAERWLERVEAAGSVFVGAYAPEALGDYCSGTNHVLPTAGWARACSGVSVDSFVNCISVQRVDPLGIRELGPVAETLARAEGLEAHRLAVAVRRAALDREASS